jgi:hypothetical protein
MPGTVGITATSHDWLGKGSNRMRIRNATTMKPAILHFSVSVSGIGIGYMIDQLNRSERSAAKSMDKTIHGVHAVYYGEINVQFNHSG